MINILLVDDEQVSLQGMKTMVPWERWNCKIIAAADSALKALGIIQTQKVDILITDIKMPEMDGLELIREVKRLQKDIQFVIVSGYGEFDYAQKAISYGVKDYLLKPVGIAELEEVLLKLIEPIKKARMGPEPIARKEVHIKLEPIIDDLVLSVTQKNWAKISQILLKMFMEISEQGGGLEQSRKLSIKLLNSLIAKEIIFYNESTLLSAGEIGSADTQSSIYTILKEQILLTQNQMPEAGREKMNLHIQKILIYLLTHYMDNNLTLKWLSRNVVFVNSDYLGKLFGQETGKSFAGYLAEFRIARASEYLKKNPDIQIYNLAEKCGYSDNVSYFIKQFKKIMGVTPAEFASSSVVKA